MWLRILSIWCTVLFCGSNAAVPLAQFFGYGTENGDQQLSTEHQQLPREYMHSLTSGRIALDPPFAIFNQSQAFIIILDDGSIYFDSGYINIFRRDCRLRRNGRAFWRKSTSKADLDKAQQEIGSAFPAYHNIDLKWTVIGTWYQVAPFGNFSAAPNTFQAILTTDGISSFALFYYNQIGWNHTISRAGFEWDNGTSSKEYRIRGTSTLANRSNVFSPGIWIFQIDQPTIYEPNPLCEVPPQPVNGLCKAEEFVPGSLALCSCKPGYKSDIMEGLKCSRLTDNRTVGWTGNVSKCCSTQMPLTPCDCTNSYIDRRLTKTAYEFTMINDTKLSLSKRRQRIAIRRCVGMPKCLVDINDVCDALLSSAICIKWTRFHYYDEHEQIFHLKMPKEWQNNTNCRKAMDVVNTSEMLEPKECPSLPIPEHGLCASSDKKPYLVGSVAHCKCLPNYCPVPNTNCNSRRECRRDQDGNLYWSGKTPVCELLE